MQWPPWSSNASNDVNARKRETSDRDQAPSIDWSYYTDARTVIATLVLTTTSLAVVHVYRTYLRRIPEVASIQAGFFRRRSLFGRVTSVGDGDNFRLFHTPGGSWRDGAGFLVDTSLERRMS